MKYFLINVKKIYKNKLNSIPVFIIILFLAFLYVGNLKSATIEFDLDSPVSIKEDINSTSEQIGLFENNLKFHLHLLIGTITDKSQKILLVRLKNVIADSVVLSVLSRRLTLN